MIPDDENTPSLQHAKSGTWSGVISAPVPKQHRIAQRLTPLIAALGATVVPNLLIRYQARLGLSSNELVYLLHVLVHRWDNSSWPWVAVNDVAAATGSAARSVKDWRTALVTKGYLALRPRGLEGGGRGADEHDLSGLFAALEALALEETLERATLEARQKLPEPSFYTGISDVPQFDLDPDQRRPGLHTQRVRAHAPRGGNSAETCTIGRGAKVPEPALSIVPEPARDKEAVNKKPLTPLPPRGRGERFSKERDRARLALTTGESAGAALLAGLYRGLGIDPSTLTAREYRGELRSAESLATKGATPVEAEEYAREMSVPARHVAITMKSFEHERASWLSRRQRETVPLLRVANGRIPE